MKGKTFRGHHMIMTNLTFEWLWSTLSATANSWVRFSVEWVSEKCWQAHWSNYAKNGPENWAYRFFLMRSKHCFFNLSKIWQLIVIHLGIRHFVHEIWPWNLLSNQSWFVNLDKNNLWLIVFFWVLKKSTHLENFIDFLLFRNI